MFLPPARRYFVADPTLKTGDLLAPLPMTNRLRVLRAERRWSQVEPAERLGVSRQTVNAVETERYEPSLSLAF